MSVNASFRFLRKMSNPDLVEWTLGTSQIFCKSSTSCFYNLRPVEEQIRSPFLISVNPSRQGITPPPAQVELPEICGMTPEAKCCVGKFSYPANAFMPSWIRAPPESIMPITGGSHLKSWSMILQNFRDIVSDKSWDTVKSRAKTYTNRPSIVPQPLLHITR
jgi:hypothetical protein